MADSNSSRHHQQPAFLQPRHGGTPRLASLFFGGFTGFSVGARDGTRATAACCGPGCRDAGRAVTPCRQGGKGSVTVQRPAASFVDCEPMPVQGALHGDEQPAERHPSQRALPTGSFCLSAGEQRQQGSDVRLMCVLSGHGLPAMRRETRGGRGSPASPAAVAGDGQRLQQRPCVRARVQRHPRRVRQRLQQHHVHCR